jgi:hypothetical protein
VDSKEAGKVAEKVDHPQHYGGDTIYEHIKVVEAWGLNYALGNATKYICRAGKKENELEDLRKAAWYLQHEIDRVERETEHNRRLRESLHVQAQSGFGVWVEENPLKQIAELEPITPPEIMKREKSLFDGLPKEDYQVPLRETICVNIGCIAERMPGSKYCTAHYGLHKEE